MNAASAKDVTLTADGLARIQELVPEGAAGARYVEGGMPVWN